MVAHTVEIPEEILEQILSTFLLDVPPRHVKTLLNLRLINRFCYQEVFRILVQYEVLSHAYLDPHREIERSFTLRFWLECLSQERRRLLASKVNEQSWEDDDTDDTHSNGSSLMLYHTRAGTILRATLLSTIDMLISMPENPTPADLESLVLRKASSSDDDTWNLWAMKLCEAFIVLTGSRLPTLVLLSDNTQFYFDSWAQGGRFFRRSREYFALIVFANDGKLEMTQLLLKFIEAKYNEHIRLGQIQEQGGLLEPLKIANILGYGDINGQDAYELHKIEWHDALQACLFISSCHPDQPLFREVFKMQTYSKHARFCFIIYDRQTLFQWIAGHCAVDLLKLLITDGWVIYINDTEYTTSNLGLAILRALRRPIETPGRLSTVELLCSISDQWQTKDVLDILVRNAAKDNDIEVLRHIFSQLEMQPVSQDYPLRHNIDQFIRQHAKDPLEYATRQRNLEMLQLLLANRSAVQAFTYHHNYRFMNPSWVMSILIKLGKDIDHAYLDELLRAVPEDSLPGRLLAASADRISAQSVRLFAQYVDLGAPAHRKPKTSTNPTVGEEALSRVLSKLQVEKAKILIEEFGLRSVGNCARETTVSEDDEVGMQALKEIQSLLHAHGMTFKTSITYHVSFCLPAFQDVHGDENSDEAETKSVASTSLSSSSNSRPTSPYAFYRDDWWSNESSPCKEMPYGY